MEGNASIMAMYEKDLKEVHSKKKKGVLVVLLSVIIILMVL